MSEWQDIETAPLGKMLVWNGVEVMFAIHFSTGPWLEATRGDPGFAGDGLGDILPIDPKPTH